MVAMDRQLAPLWGRAIRNTLNLVSITKEEYQQSILVQNKIVEGNNIEIDGRSYSIARGPLQVGNDRIGVFAVALPLDFVLKSGAG